MLKKPQLIVFGIIFLGVFLFGIGIYLLAKESSSSVPVIASTYSTPVPVSVTPAANKAKSKPANSEQPVVQATPAPVKRPPSSVQWIRRDSYLGGNTWKVSLTSNKWFDTGIPYVTNDTLNISEYGSQDTNTHTLIKVNGRVFSNKEGRQIFYFDRDGFAPSIRDTVKLKLEDGAEPVELELTVIHVNAICPDYENHQDIHEASFAWADNLVSRTKR